MGPGDLKGLMQPIINDVAKEIYYSDWEQGRDNFFDYDLNFKYSKPSSLKRVMYEHHYQDRSFKIYEEYVKSEGKYMHNFLADL